MYLFYAPDIITSTYVLSEEESRHCTRVLRLETGDIIYLTNGKGSLYKAEIEDNNFKSCRIRILEEQKDFQKRDYKLHIAIAPPKNINRFEWFLEKATEIGIDEITPIVCEHSERKFVKPERMEKIITSAVKQSYQTFCPILYPEIPFGKFINSSFNGEKYIASCEESFENTLKKLYKPRQDVIILIGPEGDFSKNEIDLSKNNGFAPISLGKSRLRTETAALAACMAIHILND